MRRASWTVVVLALVGCAEGPRPVDAPAGKPRADAEKPLPIPADLAPHIRESIELGRALYLFDKVSAIGTDVAQEQLPDVASRGVAGWLTLREGDASGLKDSYAVMFLSRDEAPRQLFTVHVPLGGKPTLEEHSPPKDLTELGLRLFRARQTAIRGVPRGDRPWNPVVLPGDVVGRPDAILVYLLAAEQQVGEMVFGIHYRVLVSEDGSTIKQALPLSRSALVVRDAEIPPGATPVAAMVSQIVTDWPLETHVFVSLLHGSRPIYVVTQRGLWRVTGDQVSLVDDKPPRTPD